MLLEDHSVSKIDTRCQWRKYLLSVTNIGSHIINFNSKFNHRIAVFIIEMSSRIVELWFLKVNWVLKNVFEILLWAWKFLFDFSLSISLSVTIIKHGCQIFIFDSNTLKLGRNVVLWQEHTSVRWENKRLNSLWDIRKRMYQMLSVTKKRFWNMLFMRGG